MVTMVTMVTMATVLHDGDDGDWRPLDRARLPPTKQAQERLQFVRHSIAGLTQRDAVLILSHRPAGPTSHISAHGPSS